MNNIQQQKMIEELERRINQLADGQLALAKLIEKAAEVRAVEAKYLANIFSFLSKDEKFVIDPELVEWAIRQ